VVMCVPTTWSEVVAYKSNQPVLWGAHGYGFHRVEPTFPRLLLPIKEIIRRYDVRYLLTMDGALPPVFEAELPSGDPVIEGPYRLFSFVPVAVDKGTDASARHAAFPVA
jgi:hypothetical protein